MCPDEPQTRAQSALDLPLTSAQEGIWLGQQLAPTSARYNAGECIALDATIDVDALSRAIARMVAESETLRMRFDARDGGARQTLTSSVFTPRRVALGARAEVEAWMRADLARPIDLTSGVLYRGAILTTPSRVYWYHAAHHIALDGYGFVMLARRVAELYDALVAGGSVPSCPFGSMASVVAEDASYRSGDACVRDRAFWCARLADLPKPVSFSDRSLFAAESALRESAWIPVDLLGALTAIAKRVRGSWGDAVIAALARALQRATGAEEVVLGLPVMGRIGSVTLKVPCMAMNVVPLRIELGGEESFLEVIATVAAGLRALRPHARYRYEQLRREQGLVGRDKRLFGPVVNLMPFDLDLRFGGSRAMVSNVGAGPVEDLSLGVIAHGDGRGAKLQLDAHPDSYARGELALIGASFLDTLAACAREPEARGVPIASSVRHESVVWGEPLATPAEDVVAAFLRRARERPEAIALEDGGARVSYASLAERAGDLAARLAARGAGPEDLVALALPRSVDAIVAMLGVLMTGAGYLPLDVDGPAGRRAVILDDARPKLMVTTVPRHVGSDDGIETLCVGGHEPRVAGEVDTSAVAYVIYTSGSTGKPNGVAISRVALSHFVAAASARYEIARDDRVLQFAPLHFDACVEEIYLTLCAGATLVLRDDAMLQSLPALARACAAHAVSVLDLPTALFHELAFALSTGAVALPSCLRTVIIGGEAVLRERVARFVAAAPVGLRLFNTYGPTEATVVATSALLAGDGAVTEAAEAPIGAPLAGVGTLLIDAQGRPVRAGETGELCLLGPTLSRGYLRRPELEARRFLALRALPGAPRGYRTGDLARRRADGLLTFVGRVDDELKISGQRVDPSEVEGVLLRHPQVREACVVAVGAAPSVMLVAHLVVDAPEPSATALRRHARATLLAAAVPQVFRFVAALPKTRNGKIDRAALRSEVPVAGGAGCTAFSLLERQVLTVFAEVLGQPELELGDDFFERGGQSLQTIQVVNRLGVMLGREIEVALVFRHPTAVELAAALSDGSSGASSASVLERLEVDAVLPPELKPLGTPVSGLRCVLLTGATGFVGVYLLSELLARTRAEVVCLVRGDDDAHAGARICAALERHGVAALDQAARVRVLRADLAAPRFGLGDDAYEALAERCDAVFHAAAMVSLTRGYASLRAANVEATLSVLRFATHARPKAVHHVSTIAVAHGDVPEAFVPVHEGLRDGYTQTKWVAERLIEHAMARGIEATVYRLGRVVGAVESGFVNLDDIVWRTIRAGVPRGVLPALDVCEPWTPVDYIARAIVEIAGGAAGGGVFNLAPEPHVRLSDVFTWVRDFGFEVELLPVPTFVARLADARDDDSVATRAFFELRAGDPRADALGRIACARLRPLACAPTAIDRSALRRYLTYCVQHGLLPKCIEGISGADE